MSLTLTGTINQVRHDVRGQNTFCNVVMETEGQDRYGRPQLEELRLSKNQVTSGYAPNIEQLVGKKVQFSVWVNAWAGRAGASYTLMMQDCNPKDCVVK